MFLLIFWEDGAINTTEEVTEVDYQSVDDGLLSIVQIEDGKCDDLVGGKFEPVLPLKDRKPSSE